MLRCRRTEAPTDRHAALGGLRHLRKDQGFDRTAFVRYNEAGLQHAGFAEIDPDEARAMPNDPTADADIFAAVAERKRAIAAQLSGRPVENVLGLVDASGACGWPEEDDQWTLAFTFHCWKIPPGSIKTRPLSVRITASLEEFDSLRNRSVSYSVVRIRAKVVEESVLGTSQAELLEFLGSDGSDSELNQAAADLQTPVVIKDRQFGKLKLDRRVNWYTAKTKWNGAAITLNLTVDDSGAIDGALTVARTLWKDQERWAKRIEDYAVRELLPLKNESWLDDEDVELSAQLFKSKMTLESITVTPDGSFDFWHNDGDLFSGHSIQVSGDLSQGPTDAAIPG